MLGKKKRKESQKKEKSLKGNPSKRFFPKATRGIKDIVKKNLFSQVRLSENLVPTRMSSLRGWKIVRDYFPSLQGKE